MCPVCSTTLDQSDSPIARRMKADIAARIAAGDTKNEIEDALVAEFGQQFLAAPPKKGFNLLAWILPFVALFGGALALGLVAWAGAAPRAPPPAAAAEPRVRAPRRRRARPLREGEPCSANPSSVLRGSDLDHHALRAAARAGLPLGGLGGRG